MEHGRRSIKAEIDRQLKIDEEKDLDDRMQKLESLKDDNSKYFYVLRDIQNMNRNNKTSMLVKDKDGTIPGSTIEKIKVIENYFKVP